MEKRLHLNKFFATGVGSLPHADPKEACRLVFKYLSGGVPFWPQLPKRSFKENMYVQYSQGLPGVVIDENNKKIYVNTKDCNPSDIYKIYAAIVAAKADPSNIDYFKIGPEYAAGFYEFIKQQYIADDKIKYVKGQIIGPISFGLTVCDQDKKAIIYNEEFRNCLPLALAMKALWQIKELKKSYPNSQVIIFIDEPYLVSLGSSYFNISQEEIINMLDNIINILHENNAFVGIHCCGNTDWPVLLRTNIDILSFDAYDYLDKLLLYRDEVKSFLNNGKVLAYGIVPTHALAKLPTLNTLIEKLGVVKENSFITPSCGLSGVSPKRAEESLELALKLSERLSTR